MATITIYIVLMANVNSFVHGIEYTLYEVTAFNVRERAVLNVLHLRNDMTIFLNGVSNEAAIPMKVLVDQCCLQEFENKMQDNGIEYVRVNNENRHKEINAPRPKSTENAVSNIAKDFYTWRRLKEWGTKKKKAYPILSEIVIGSSEEGRPVTVLKLSKAKKNKAVFLLGGEDGKDWLSAAVLYNLINYMLEKKWQVEYLLEHYDFYILPILNPDGYEYSISTDRYWSKNRRIFYPLRTCNGNKTAIGVNLDRNWFFNDPTRAGKHEECSSIFAGTRPLSEEETYMLANFLDKIALKMMAFINVKGFDRLLTLPYGYTKEETTNHALMMELLSSVNDKVIEEHKASFFYGTTVHYRYNVTGTSADWVKRNLNTPMVYSVYLQNEEHLLPVVEDITPLADQFACIVTESLMLANSIYGPLFKNQSNNVKVLQINMWIIIIMCFYL